MTAAARETAFQVALGALYETALDSNAWAEFMSSFAGMVGACGAQFLVWNDATNAMGYTSVIGAFAPDAAQRYGEYYGAIDPRRELLYAKGDAGWLQCHEHFNASFVSRSEFYNDFLIPVGARYLSVLHTFNNSGNHGTLGFLRPPDQAPFDNTDFQFFQRVELHVKRASRIWWKMKQLSLRADMGERALDALSNGVLIVDHRGSVRFQNEAAVRWLSGKPGVGVSGGRLRGTEPAVTSALDRLIANATSMKLTASTSGTLALPRPSGSAWQLFVVPLRSNNLDLNGDDPCALLVVGDPNATGSLNAAQMSTLFMLTAAEARLATALCGGTALDSYAQQCGISINTARAQLRAVLQKTGTHRQADLVRLLNSAPRLVDKGR